MFTPIFILEHIISDYRHFVYKNHIFTYLIRLTFFQLFSHDDFQSDTYPIRRCLSTVCPKNNLTHKFSAAQRRRNTSRYSVFFVLFLENGDIPDFEAEGPRTFFGRRKEVVRGDMLLHELRKDGFQVGDRAAFGKGAGQDFQLLSLCQGKPPEHELLAGIVQQLVHFPACLFEDTESQALEA